MTRIRYIFILALLSTVTTLAQNDTWYFRHYGVDNDLPSDCVRDMVQSADGFIWMATDGGVTRFDGSRFKNYKLESRGNDRDDNYAMSLCAAGNDLWVATDAHLYKYNQEIDGFEYVMVTDRDGRDRVVNIRDIAYDRDGNLWLATMNIGVVRLKPAENSYKIDNFGFPELHSCLFVIYVDSRNDVWALSSRGSNSIYRLDKSVDNFRKIELDLRSDKPATIRPSVIVEDPNHMMWIGTSDGWLMSFDPFSFEGKAVNTASVPNGPLMRIHSILPAEDGKLLVGSDAGLAYYDVKSRRFLLYRQDETNPQALTDQFVYPIIRDHEGGIWIGTYYGGVNYLSPNTKRFDSYHASQYRNSVSGNVISSFVERADGKIFIGSEDNGLSLYSPNTNAFEEVPLGHHVNVETLMLDNGDLWVGTYASGLYVLDAATGQQKRHYSDGDHLPEQYCDAMMRDRKGELWLGFGNNLTKYNRSTDQFDLVKNIGARISDITEDREGKVWIATQGQGIYVYNPENQVWTHYLYSPLAPKLPHNHVYVVTVDGAGNIWIGAETGLLSYNKESDDFVEVDMPFKSAKVMSIIEDQGSLWYTTPMGLVKRNSDGTNEVYTRSDGLASNQFMNDAIMKSSNGRIYVGSRSGFSAFVPFMVRTNDKIPQIYITDVKLNNQLLEASDEKLTSGDNGITKVVMEPGDNTVNIEFSSLSYTNPEKNQYKYRMSGVDKDWVLAGNTNQAFYTNLAPGKHTFQVIGSNSDNLWNEQGATLEIVVRPPWYQTWWMKIVYLLALIGAVVLLIYQLRRRDSNKHKQELRKVQSDKELEVYQAKLSFFTMVAHEIRTPVSLIIGPLEKMMRNAENLPQAVMKNLGIIESNSQRLLVLVNQLLDFKKVEEQGMQVEYRTVKLMPIVRNVIDRFVPSLQDKYIDLKLDADVPEDFECDIDAEALTKLISNLLNNARKFTHTSIILAVSASDDAKNFMISVTDDGDGISKKDLKRIFQPFFQVSDTNHSQGGTGLGLSIVQSVAVAHRGKMEVKSELGRGTCFVAVLPVHQENVVIDDAKVDAADDEGLDRNAIEPMAEKPRMLVVDDNIELCNFIANSFDDRYEVITAADGEEALRILGEKEVSLIISDWMMPKMDGVELCRAVRADMRLSHLPFVLLTAKTDDMSKVEGLNCGADSYVEKPFSLRVLEATIENLLSLRRMLKQRYAQSPLETVDTIATNPTDNEFMTQLTNIIEENFANPELDIELLADKMDISRSGMYAKIRSLTDITPNELIRLTRLKHAAKLLRDGKYRINEVGYMVGFNSSSYFAKCFHQQFGLTPSEFIGGK